MSISSEKTQSTSWWAWIILILILLFVVLLRFHLLALPLESDEGEYAYIAQLIMHGIPPYADAYSMKMPGIYVIYAIILAVFGQTPFGIHMGLMVVNIISTILIFLVAKRLMNAAASLAASACFAVLSVNPYIHGVIANAEHFVILFALSGILLLLIAVDKNKLHYFFWSGFCLGLAFLVKQHGVFFIAFGGLYLLYDEMCKSPVYFKSLSARVLVFSAGVVIPFVIACLILKQVGVFDKFWFWTYTYSREYVSLQTLSQGLKDLADVLNRYISSAFFLCALGVIGLCFVFLDRKIRQKSVFICLLMVLSLISVCPGFYFRPHYFLLVVPVFSLLCGFAFQAFTYRISNKTFRLSLPPLIVILSLVQSVDIQRELLFKADMATACDVIYGLNILPETFDIARYIKDHSTDTDRIAILGSEPEILFYAKRRSATGYIYMYPLMEIHPYTLKMQRDAITEIESSKPKFLILFGIDDPWIRQGIFFPDMLLEWVKQYSTKYERVGVIDKIYNAAYFWDGEASKARHATGFRVSLYQRKTEND